MKKVLLVALLLICAAVAFLTFNGGHYGGISLPWAKPAPSNDAIITYTLENGFSPSNITVNSGDTVEIRNLSTAKIVVESDAMTTDQSKSDRELNLGSIESDTHKDFTVTNKGSFEYHNDSRPDQTGMITVK